MSDRERIAQVTQRKWATMSESLRSLKTNEQLWAIRGNERMSDSLQNYGLKNLKSCFLVCFTYGFFILKMSDLLIPSFLVSDVSELLRPLNKNERCERSWGNRSGGSPKMSEWVNSSFFWANCSFAHFWAKHERFARKTDEGIPSPAWQYPSVVEVCMLTNTLWW